jgi:hypothetical protein
MEQNSWVVLFDLDVQHFFGFESPWKSDIMQVFFVKKIPQFKDTHLLPLQEHCSSFY